MVLQHLLDAHARYGNVLAEMCRMQFRCNPEVIKEDVILAPFWTPEIFAGLVDSIIPFESKSPVPGPSSLWTLDVGGKKVSFIKTGVGAPITLDSVFSLSQSPCKRIIFIGAVGALNTHMKVGDIVIPEYSVSGDGACRYLTLGTVKDGDCFGEKQYPDSELFQRLLSAAKSVVGDSQTSWHIGKTFSVDTIFAEFAHLDEIVRLGCDSIEMETSALFKAASVCGIKAGAIFIVSDNVYEGKSLYTPALSAEKRRTFEGNDALVRITLESIMDEK